MNRLSGKVAVITGGGTGIGLASALGFAAEGAEVVIIGRRQEELNKALQLIGPTATAIQADISKLDDLDRVYTQVKATKGPDRYSICKRRSRRFSAARIDYRAIL